MKRYKSIRRWFLAFVALSFFAVALPGCNDPMVSDLEERNQEFEFFIEQELQRSKNASKIESTITLPPAQAADMEAERRELDRKVERGDWQSLFN